MLLNCTRLKHACTILKISQIPRPGINIINHSLRTTKLTLRQQPITKTTTSPHLLLLRRSYHQLFKVRPPATVGRSAGGERRFISLRSFLRQAENTKNALAENAQVPTKGVIKMARSNYTRLMSLMKTEKWTLLAGILCLVVSSVITMTVPWFIGKVVDTIFKKHVEQSSNMARLREYSLMLFWVFVLGGVANFARVYFFGTASLRIVKRLRSNLYRSMLMKEVGWFDTKGSGELVNRLSNDTYFVGIALSQNVSDGLRSMAMILAGAGMMLYTSVKLSLVSALVVPALAGMAIVYGRYVRRITRAELDKYAEIMKHAEERFGNVRTVKLFCREPKECEQFDSKLDEAVAIAYKETRARSIFFGLTGFSGNFIIISVLYYGGTLVLDGELTVGAMTSFMMYAGYVAVSMNTLSSFYSQLNKGVGASERIWEIFDRDPAIPLDKGLVPDSKPNGEINFQNIEFSFPSRPESKVLTNFNLTLQPNQTTAIVGRSGSGKSTTALLMMRLYDPDDGAVYLDGVDMRSLNPHWLRSNIGAVSQEPVLFSGSIRDNILYGMHPDDPVNEETLEQVVRDSNVIEFTSQLPDGLNTLVGQRGMLLSGGQKQRVAIARALIKNPTILVLDEATSALDSVSEQLVQSAIDRLIQGRTVLTIAHRLSTIQHADKIAVLDNGRIVEQGTYEELMRDPQGAFRELVSMQAFGGGI
ncbi:ATP-binding cassette sub-family B member 10, mitochondrial isoform X1 [Drosophila busckii]|uniref:ATP-binding cassette sub-family B member 10, mitochondrial isoform X1 n=1 Tax=Drosophila busckii TaxID=30019 RepID=UPI00083EB50F|nr:ATP-binding cassette sub-family B member 10, mitochondrial isoform X1 [Drosophila busckii]